MRTRGKVRKVAAGIAMVAALGLTGANGAGRRWRMFRPESSQTE
jgi:hypothetical protein